MKIKNNRAKLFLAVMVLVFSCLIIYGTSRYVQIMAEHSHAEFEDFREKSISASFTIQNHIDKEIESLFEMRDVFRLKGRALTRFEFSMIAKSILSRNEGIHALEWIPRVVHEERSVYEEEALADGIANFSFKAISGSGEVTLSPEKTHYYPVYYIEPIAGNEAALGLDLASSNPRREALLKSLKTNRAIASEGVRLVQDEGEQQGVLIFLSVNNQNPVDEGSLLLGVFRIRDMLASVFSDGSHPDLNIYVYDLDDESNLYPLASLGGEISRDVLPTIEELTSGDNSVVNVSTIDIADRQWALVIKPVIPIIHKDAEYLAWLVSLLLLAVMLLLVMYFYSKFRHAYRSREAHIRYQSLSERLQAILDNTIDGIITINHEGIIQSVNKAGLTMFGYSSDEMIGRNVKMITPEPVKMEHDSYLKNYLGGKPPKIIGTGRDVEGVRKNGVKIPLRLGVSKAKVNGEVVFIGLLHDISERKNNEKIKDEFISTVNHELRTPLTSILGSIQLIKKVGGDELNENYRKLLDISERNTHRIIKIVNDILDLQKINSGEMTFDFMELDLVEITRKSIEQCQPFAAQHCVSLTFIPLSRTFNVIADKLRIEQVITNLLSNAIKFSPENANVIVHIDLVEDDGMVLLSVEDEGPGISTEFMDKLFQPFTQAESHMTRKVSGTGLGLSISKSIIEKHSGSIGVRNSTPAGACFYFELPLAREIK